MALNDDTMMNPFITATPRIEMKPTPAEMLKFSPVIFNAQNPPTAIASTLPNTTSASSWDRKAR
jgi:hypothetical protein